MTEDTVKINPAVWWTCPLDVTAHCVMHGRAGQRKCPGCGAKMAARHGTWGAFTWTGDGRYPLSAAHRTFSQYGTANRWAGGRDLVVRWVGR